MNIAETGYLEVRVLLISLGRTRKLKFHLTKQVLESLINIKIPLSKRV